MVLFPFTTSSFTVRLWAYGATSAGGKYLDAAAYYSSLGLVADAVWLLALLLSWRALTRERWRTEVVPGRAPALGPRSATFMPERALLALVPEPVLLRRVPDDRLDDVGPRAGPTRDRWRVHGGYPFDLSPGGPWWMTARTSGSRHPVDGASRERAGAGRRVYAGRHRAVGADGSRRDAASATRSRTRLGDREGGIPVRGCAAGVSVRPWPTSASALRAPSRPRWPTGSIPPGVWPGWRLFVAIDPHHGRLCRRHADAMVVPQGWWLEDRRTAEQLFAAPPPPLGERPARRPWRSQRAPAARSCRSRSVVEDASGPTSDPRTSSRHRAALTAVPGLDPDLRRPTTTSTGSSTPRRPCWAGPSAG